MASKTSDKTAAKLAALLDKHHHEGPAALHGHILDVFRVLDQPATRAAQPTPEVGQSWRNRTSARLVKITAIGGGPWSDQVEWECIDGSRGQKTGSVWRHGWTDRFDYEETN